MATPDAATMRKLQAQGKAMPNASGKPSFQIRNADDLDNAIMAVGRVKPGPETRNRPWRASGATSWPARRRWVCLAHP